MELSTTCIKLLDLNVPSKRKEKLYVWENIIYKHENKTKTINWNNSVWKYQYNECSKPWKLSVQIQLVAIKFRELAKSHKSSETIFSLQIYIYIYA